MNTDKADVGNISPLLKQMGEPVPREGVGIKRVMEELGMNIIPNGSQIPNPGCTSFITTGATNAGILANLAGSVASPQRIGLTAFNYLEELSLQWLADMFELPGNMKGVYSSGGSVANLVALGAARQWAFERQGIDPAAVGVNRPAPVIILSIVLQPYWVWAVIQSSQLLQMVREECYPMF